MASLPDAASMKVLSYSGTRPPWLPTRLRTFRLHRYRASAAITAYQEFPARSHNTIGEPGWEQVADYALRWAVENGLNGT